MTEFLIACFDILFISIELGDSKVASDCISEVYFTTWRTIPPNRPHDFQVFLERLSREIALTRFFANIDSMVGNRQLLNILEEISMWIPKPYIAGRTLTCSEIGSILDNFIRSLSQIEQRIFVCRYWYFDSIDTIHAIHKLSYKKIASILFQLGRKLMLRLQKEVFGIG